MSPRTIKLALVVQLSLILTSGGDVIEVLHEGGSSEAKVLRVVQDDERWLEVEYPAGAAPRRILISQYYAFVDGLLIGIFSESFGLVINKSIAVDSESGETPTRWKNALCIIWKGLFGHEAFGRNAGPQNPVVIDEINPASDGLEISLTIRERFRGAFKLTPDFRLAKVELENETVPIFTDPLLFSNGGRISAPIFSEVLQGENGPVKIWQRTLIVEARDMSLAKAILNDREVAWLGPSFPKWVLLDGELWGVAPEKDGKLLVRKAVFSDTIENAIGENLIAGYKMQAWEGRFYSGDLIPIPEVGPDPHLRSISMEGDVMKIELSSTAFDNKLKGEVQFSPSRREATVTVGSRVSVISGDKIGRPRVLDYSRELTP
jgi:hypothetical protein